MSDWIEYTSRWHDTWEIVGAIASTIGSAATVGAVVVALLLGRQEARARAEAQEAELDRLRQERDEARAERDRAEEATLRREREAQARRVVVQDVMTVTKGNTEANEVEAGVHNFSDMPVFDLALFCPSQRRQPNRGPQVDALPPGGSRSHSFRGVDSTSVSYVTFRDAFGLGWERRADGSLRELSVAPRARQFIWPEETEPELVAPSERPNG
ncbi:hypothetical protein GCM10028784_25720 [Myceligenerans cantabricum]